MAGPDDREAPNAGQAAFWTDLPGQKWALLHTRLDRLFSEATALLLDRAGIAPGEDILDIGCGAGDTTLAAARLCGPAGSATGVDISETLLAEARRRGAGVPGVTFVHADAQTHAFAPACYDLLISRFGLMFFADPVTAFANIATGLRPGARVVFAAWAPAEENPWSHVPKAAGTDHFGPLPPDEPREPGQFAFAERDYAAGILAAAGYTDVAAEAADIHLRFDGNAADAADLATTIGPVSRFLREKNGTEEDRRAIAEVVARGFGRWESPDGMRIPARLNVFGALKPRESISG